MIIDDVETLLVEAGLCTALGTDLFKNRAAKIPEGSGPYTTLVGVGGSQHELRHGSTRRTYGKPSAHITVRAATATAARNKIEQEMAALEIDNTIVNDTFYLWIRPNTSEPQELEPDERGRPRFSFAITAMSTSVTVV